MPEHSGGLFREHKVRSFFTAPTAFRAVKREDPKGEFKAGLRPKSCLRASIWPVNALTQIRLNGRMMLGVPVMTIGGKPKQAGPLPGNPMGVEPLARQAGQPHCGNAGV
jgi:propionyl-CoA synthetase